MPPLRGPLALHSVAQALVDEILVRLTAEAVTGAAAPERACVYPGLIAWDDCTCGELAVSVARTYPSENFPVETFGSDLRSGTGTPCPPPLLLADLVVQVIRCAPGPTASGAPPTCAELDASARAVLTDAYLARQGAFCRLQELEASRDITDFLVRGQGFLGPSGGCVGSELAVTVGVRAICC